MKSKDKLKMVFIAIFRQLGGIVNGDELVCTGKSGIVKIDTGKGLRPISIDPRSGKPEVHRCEHEAVKLAMEYMSALLNVVDDHLIPSVDATCIPSIRDFHYVHCEAYDLPDDTDMATDEASEVIKRIKETL